MFPPHTTALEIYKLIINHNPIQVISPALDHIETHSNSLVRFHFADGSIIEAKTTDDRVTAYFINQSGYPLDEQGNAIANIPSLEVSRIEPKDFEDPNSNQTPSGDLPSNPPSPDPVPVTPPTTPIAPNQKVEAILAAVAARLGLDLGLGRL